MNILVTGGAGFIGAHTVRGFICAGHDVTILDSFVNYKHPIQPWFIENMQYRREHLIKGAEIIEGSTLDKLHLYRIINRVQPDRIVHFASLPLANLALSRSEMAFQHILVGTVNMLEALKDYQKLKNFVYISSSMAYGSFREDPQSEYVRMLPQQPYGAFKLAGEIATQAYGHSYDIPYTIIRPSAVYGPGDCNMRVIQTFLTKAFKHERIQVRGNEKLDFTYVTDTAKGILLATLGEGKGDIFNITYGQAHSLMEVVEYMSLPDELGYCVMYDPVDAEDDRPARGALDINEAKGLLGYNPLVHLEDGLKFYTDWMCQYNSFARR